MRAKLTVAQVEILTAYRDNGFHNRTPRVVSGLIDTGYLAPVFDEASKRWELSISRSGALVLEAFEKKEASQR